ncbi:MAG: late competence development ComFB family protein [Spirulinaceae cyanobacterium]
MSTQTSYAVFPEQTTIRGIVQKALDTGYLSVEAENSLRELLKQSYDQGDFNAFLKLQQAAMEGGVKQESRELVKAPTSIYCNALEPLVRQEVEEQIQKLPAKLAFYINPHQAIAYALNRLPALYATSEEGWQRQQQKAKEELGDKISIAVRWGINAVIQDPLRVFTPLKVSS